MYHNLNMMIVIQVALLKVKIVSDKSPAKTKTKRTKSLIFKKPIFVKKRSKHKRGKNKKRRKTEQLENSKYSNKQCKGDDSNLSGSDENECDSKMSVIGRKVPNHEKAYGKDKKKNSHQSEFSKYSNEQVEETGSNGSDSEENNCEKCIVCCKYVSTGKVCCTVSCKSFKHFFCEDCYEGHVCNKPDKDNCNSKNMSCKVKKHLKKKRKRKNKAKKEENLLKTHLGSADAVSVTYNKNKRSFVYKCPNCSKSITEKLSRHLQNAHDINQNDADLLQSKMRVLFLWCCIDKHNTNLPLPCKDCSTWYTRLDQHLKTSVVHSKMTDDERSKKLEETKKEYWSREENVVQQETPITSFIRRAPANLKSATNSMEQAPVTNKTYITYTPGKSIALTDEHRRKWNIQENDFFTIYFETSNELLDYFQESLCSSYLEKATAIQHRNQIEFIWSTIDSSMNMFPASSLSNIHLFRDAYHIPAYKAIGSLEGVQAGTLRARYVSLGFFLQFLRKFQVFAGLSRASIQMLEQTVNDFNKDLNPLIKQRKVEVRRNKTKNLMTARHFIRFGQSEFIQSLIKAYNMRSMRNFSYGFAVDFRNYLIASLCIGNGLRASNVIELRLKDFNEFSTSQEYPGHKIVVNDNYKTSTIYGEKFVVVPDELFDHYTFYAEKLRTLIYEGKSERAFVANGSLPNLTHTLVSASLTSVFSKAKIFSATEYQRVSCTRIRCGLATFACNEGGFETAFVANHFMKNKEETTALHYNLLANRRHALNIAMKLYDTFKMSNGKKLEVNRQSIQDFFLSAPKQDKATILNWLKEKDQSIDKTELRSIESSLKELEDTDSCNFYGSHQENRNASSSELSVESPVRKEITIANNKDLKAECHHSTSQVKSSEVEIAGAGNDCANECSAEDTSVDTAERYDTKSKIRSIKPSKSVPTKQAVSPKLKTPKRKRLFSHFQVKILREKCKDQIYNGGVTDEVIAQALQGEEENFKNIEFRQIRARIAFERMSLFKKKKKNEKKKYQRKRISSEKLSDDSAEEESYKVKTPLVRKTYPKRERKECMQNLALNNAFREWEENEDEENDDSASIEKKDVTVLEEETSSDENSLKSCVPLVPSQVKEYCNEEFRRAKRRKNIELNRSLQIEKAKQFSTKGEDQEGFEKIYIHKYIKGYGIFATKTFFEDDFLLTYKGELVTGEEGVKRESIYKNDDTAGSFLYFFYDYTEKRKSKWCVDATKVDSLCRFVNDSVNFNCKMSLVRTAETLYLRLFATKDIPAGTELRYNYGDDSKRLWWRNEEEGYFDPLNKDVLLSDQLEDPENVIQATPRKKKKRSDKTDFNIAYRTRRNNSAESIEIMD